MYGITGVPYVLLRITILLAGGLMQGVALRPSNSSDSPREHVMIRFFITVLALTALAASAFAGENLRLNPKLDYTSDSQDGPLITGDCRDAGFITCKPAYVIIYGEGCSNSKRQARRTVGLYQIYKGRVQFVVIDIDHRLSREQKELKKKYFRGYIPHVVILDASGSALYNRSGEVDGAVISRLLENTLR